MNHTLKISPSIYTRILEGTKQFLVIKNEDDIQVGDTIELKYENPKKTRDNKEPLLIEITYMWYGGQNGIYVDYCVFGFKLKNLWL